MDFAMKIVVLFLLVLGAFGRSVPFNDASINATELNRTISSPEDGSCELNGIFYPLNSVFNVPINPCIVCECNENWTGAISNTSCYKEECDEIIDKPQEECIPVYDETKCCVIDFYCRDSIVPDFTEESEIENDNSTEGKDEVICPTPICADESCRIEVPPGQLCPTCICEELKERNDFESPEQLPERPPLESQNSSEDVEFFLIPVPWNGIADGPENSLEDVSREALEQGNYEYGEFREDSVLNILPGDVISRRTEPRRRRSTYYTAQQQQQQWRVLQDEDQTSESSEIERENLEDGSEDFGGMKIFGQEESKTAESTNQKTTDLYSEENLDASGCPTPMCQHAGCRIEIPPGRKCPTCVCGPR